MGVNNHDNKERYFVQVVTLRALERELTRAEIRLEMLNRENNREARSL